MNYRADIDGLRAVAVLAVVFFHTGMPFFGGGYVGVDVFFVISGYLITGIILDAFREGTFSFATFYERRARRILPALLAVALFTTLAASVFLVPGSLKLYGLSAAATALFGSNIFFFLRTDYFAPASEAMPLLHTWSLSVEEQFYLVYPIVLILGLRHLGQGGTKKFLVGAWFISLAACVFAGPGGSPAAFYLLPFRMWELLTGAMITLGLFSPPKSSPLRTALFVAGMAATGAAVFLFNSETPFPGGYALIPVLGTAFILYSGTWKPSGLAKVTLENSAIVHIGRTSYSLYLWHWPLCAFARYVYVSEPPLWIRVFLVAGSFALAELSFRFVETPFRKPGKFRRRTIFLASGFSLASLAVAGVSLQLLQGFPNRYRNELQTLISPPSTIRGIEGDGLARQMGLVGGELIPIGKPSVPPSFAVWGDSHARALKAGLAKIASDRGISGVIIAKVACPPLLGVDRVKETERPCTRFNDAVVRYLNNNADLERVLLVARWALASEATGFGSDIGREHHLQDESSVETGREENHAVFGRGLERTLRALRRIGKKAYVVASIPEPGFEVPRVLASNEIWNRGLSTDVTVDTYLQRQGFVLETMRDLGRTTGATILYPHEVLCRTGKCLIVLNGTSLYVDNNHLSVPGAIHIGGILAKALD